MYAEQSDLIGILTKQVEYRTRNENIIKVQNWKPMFFPAIYSILLFLMYSIY